MLKDRAPLKAGRILEFLVTSCSVTKPYILWKVLNRGPEAEKRDMIRGQVITDKSGTRLEHSDHSDFKGDHAVECYVVKQDHE